MGIGLFLLAIIGLMYYLIIRSHWKTDEEILDEQLSDWGKP